MKNITEVKVITKDFIYRREHYTICYSEEINHYLAINHKDIDSNGKLTRELNGLQLFLNDNIEGVITNIKNYLDIEYLISKGFTKGRAVAHVFKIPYTEAVENIFNN